MQGQTASAAQTPKPKQRHALEPSHQVAAATKDPISQIAPAGATSRPDQGQQATSRDTARIHQADNSVTTCSVVTPQTCGGKSRTNQPPITAGAAAGAIAKLAMTPHGAILPNAVTINGWVTDIGASNSASQRTRMLPDPATINAKVAPTVNAKESDAPIAGVLQSRTSTAKASAPNPPTPRPQAFARTTQLKANPARRMGGSKGKRKPQAAATESSMTLLRKG